MSVEADSAIIHLDKLRNVLAESGVLPRVRSLNQMCWGVKGHAASFGHDVEVQSLASLGLGESSNLFSRFMVMLCRTA